MYRWWGIDECGDGFWDMSSSEWITDTPFDFSTIFPPRTPSGAATYVTRYRPGSHTVVAKDPEGKPLKAVLQVLPGVESDYPGFRDPLDPDDSNWITVPGGWQLLDDRLGIQVTAANPDGWTTTEGPATGGSKPSVVHIRALTGTAAPTPDSRFTLRLTTVVEADRRINVEAPTRPASPTQFVRERVVDGKDHFQYCVIDKSSINYAANKGDGTNPVVIRDDTAAATTHAEQLRSAHEFPTLRRVGNVAVCYRLLPDRGPSPDHRGPRRVVANQRRHEPGRDASAIPGSRRLRGISRATNSRRFYSSATDGLNLKAYERPPRPPRPPDGRRNLARSIDGGNRVVRLRGAVRRHDDRHDVPDGRRRILCLQSRADHRQRDRGRHADVYGRHEYGRLRLQPRHVDPAERHQTGNSLSRRPMVLPIRWLNKRISPMAEPAKMQPSPPSPAPARPDDASGVSVSAAVGVAVAAARDV